MFTLRFASRPAAAVVEVCQSGARVQTWRDVSGAVCAHGYAGPDCWAMELPGTGMFSLPRRSFSEGGLTIHAFPTPEATRERVEDLYRRTVVPLFLQALGGETLHASAITTSRGAIAFCGERGAGKSTIAYGLAARGFEQHADDTLVLRVSEGSVTTEPLPFTPRLRPQSAAFFRSSDAPDTAPVVSSQSEPLSAVFILERDETLRHPQVKKLAPPQAFQALLAHAHCFEPDNPTERRRLLANYLDISTRVQVFEVAYAPGLEGLDRLLDLVLGAAGVELPPEGGNHTSTRSLPPEGGNYTSTRSSATV